MSSRADANAVLRDGGRGNTSRSITLMSRGARRVSDRRHLRAADRIAAAGAIDRQAADDRLRLRHRRPAVGAHGTDGRRLPDAGCAQAVLRPPDARAERDAGVRGRAFTNRFRMVFSGNAPIELDGKQYKENRDRPQANFEQVTGTFFGVTGQRLLEGRTFNDDDLDARQPVAIVNAAFARKHFGADSALGRRFRTMTNNGTQPGTGERLSAWCRMCACSGRSTIPTSTNRASTCRSTPPRWGRRCRRLSSASSQRSS